MRRKNRLVRLFRALSGKTQKDYAASTGVHPVLLAKYELGGVEPRPEHLDRLARGVDLTVPAGEDILRYAEARREPRQRAGQGAEDLAGQAAALVTAVYENLLRSPLSGGAPRAADRDGAGELWAILEGLPEEHRLTVVRVAREFQVWPLVERACDESMAQASRDPERAAALARLAEEIAARVRGPEGWRHRVYGYATANRANLLRITGPRKEAEAALEEALRLWHAGSDPDRLLDPAKLL